MKRLMLWSAIFLAWMSCECAEIVLDGKLDENVWKQAKEHADFQNFKGSNATTNPMPKTSFRVVDDGANLYLGIFCSEPSMKTLVAPKKKYPWGSDLVEIFLSPSGRQDEFYQFVVSAGNVRWCEYYGEGGNIRPDPGYAPLWDSAVFCGKDFWSAEIRIPLAGFYQTRNIQWQTTWLFNVTRSRMAQKTKDVTWSPLVFSNQASHLFRKLSGFPERKATDDLFIENVTADLQKREGASMRGQIKMSIFSAEEGTRTLSFQGKKHQVKLINGKNKLTLPAVFEKSQGKEYITFVFEDGLAGRTYPVMLTYEPVLISLTTPGYSDTFYPGQDRSRVAGSVTLKEPAEVVVTFEGPGVKTQKIVFPKGKLKNNFQFKSAGIGKEGAVITAICGKEKVLLKVNAPEPIKHQMAWIEDGHAVSNGKPVFMRRIYGMNFGTGTCFNELFAKERETFHFNNDELKMVNLEPRRLVNGIEEAEAVFDRKPSERMFDSIKKKIEKNRNRDFFSYYLNDEPECRNVSPVYLEYLYKYIKTLDPFHPIEISTREPARYVKCADILAPHPYWNPYFDGRGNRLLTTQLDTIPDFFKGWLAPNKVGALTLQVFSYRNFWNRTSDVPTLDEMESATWGVIANGGAGVTPYNYHDLGDRAVLYEGMQYLMSSLVRLDSFLMTADKKKLESPEKTHAALFTAKGHKLLILVNLSNKEVIMRAPYKGLTEFCGDRTFNGSVKLGAYQTALFTDVKMDQGLVSRKAVKQRIAEAEKKRLGTKNIFLEKGFEINISGSKRESFGTDDWVASKLFDGTFTMMAWKPYSGKDAWIELGFPKFTPEFSRLIVHGCNLKNMKVKYWKDGEWRDLLKDAKISSVKYRTEIQCRDTVRTVKLRLEFPKSANAAELYEIEAYNDNTSSQKSVEIKAADFGPDNVLWSMNREKYNTKAPLKIFTNKEGKLTVLCEKMEKGVSPSASIWFSQSKDYPYLVFRLNAGRNTTAGSYHAWAVNGPGMGSFFQDQVPIPGIYVINLTEKGPVKTAKNHFNIYSYAEELIFDDISVVKQLECMVSAKLKNDGITVTVNLAAPAESVSMKICYKFYPLTKALNLKPADQTRKVWQGTFPFEKPLQYRKQSKFGSGALDLRIDVLGGNIPVPVFTKMFQAYPVK